MTDHVAFGANKFYFFGNNAIENVKDYIQNYEWSTLSRFIKVKSKCFAKPDRSQLNRRVFWESRCKELPIPFDGVPFVVLGHQVQECFNGPDRHRARKKKEAKNKQDNFCVKDRKRIQTSKKMDCPATIHLRSVVRFPALQIEGNSETKKRKLGKKLRADLVDDGKEVVWEHRVYMALPGEDAHKNHLVDNVSCLTHDVHKNIITKIHEFVADGVRNITEMKRLITTFSKATFPAAPDTSNRFYPNKKCLRNHMYAALNQPKSSIEHAEGQENVQQPVRTWEVVIPDDNFYYVPSPMVENEEGDVVQFFTAPDQFHLPTNILQPDSSD